MNNISLLDKLKKRYDEQGDELLKQGKIAYHKTIIQELMSIDNEGELVTDVLIQRFIITNPTPDYININVTIDRI